MTTGPTDVKVTTAAGGPDGMPLALKLNEELGVSARMVRVECCKSCVPASLAVFGLEPSFGWACLLE